MGSTKHSHSNRARVLQDSPSHANQCAVLCGKDIHFVLGRLSDAIAFVLTAGKALLRAEEQEGQLNVGSVGHELVALEHGIGALQHAYAELDDVIRVKCS